MLIKNMLFAYYDTQCLYAVSKLKIAEWLEAGKKSSYELATLAQCDEEKLYRIMRFLSAKGLFDEGPERIFSLNKESQYLLSSGHLHHFIELHSKYFYQSANCILESLSSFLTPFAIYYDNAAWQFFEKNPQAGQTYHLAMHELSEYYGKLAVTQYDFSVYKTIIDVGGGLGSFLVNILKAYPIATGINMDLPSLQADAEAYFKREGVSSRCHYIGGDFFTVIPTGGDLYLLKAILHGKNDEQALNILNNVKKVLTPSGKILLIERMITPQNHFLDACVNDVNMLNVTHGAVRTFEEYKNLFTACHFEMTMIKPLEDAIQMIELKMK